MHLLSMSSENMQRRSVIPVTMGLHYNFNILVERDEEPQKTFN